MELNIRPYYRQRHERREKALQSAALSAGEKAEERRKDDRDREILKTMWTMIPLGLGVFLGAFGIWTLDNIYCQTLREWRHEIGLPWGILLEGHGIWHLGTGLGAYYYITWGLWLRHCLNGRQDEFEMIWPSIWASLPRVERVQTVANGSAKKLK